MGLYTFLCARQGCTTEERADALPGGWRVLNTWSQMDAQRNGHIPMRSIALCNFCIHELEEFLGEKL